MTGSRSGSFRHVGKRIVAPDWDERTTGRTVYTGDLVLEGMLEAVVVRSPHAHAEIVGIDAAAARAMPGVRYVLTSADFTDGRLYQHRGGPLSDRPPLPTDRVRFIGQEVAVVAAEDLATARRAAERVRVRYRPLPAPLTIAEALAPDAPTLHDRGSGEANVSVRWTGAWGTGGAAFDDVTTEVSGRFVFPSVSQAAMEPGVALARWDELRGRLELWTSTQAPYFVAKEVAHVLGLDQEAVVTREVAVGGGFGAKSKIREHEVLAARLAMLTGRPVMLRLSRAEEFATTKPRHRFETSLRLGADAEGRLRALDAKVDVDNGAFNHYGSSVMKVAVLALGSLYQPVGATFDARLVDTAKQPGGQFRGYGIPQTSLAMESLVDELAAACGQDPIAFRIANDAPPGRTLSGAEVHTTALRTCLETVRDELDWDAKRRARRPLRGLGVAVGMHGSGAYAYERANESEATIDVEADGTVRVRFGGADAGTGQRVLIAQAAAETLDVDPATVAVQMMDGEATPFDMGAWSSRGTHMSATAVREAALLTAGALRELARTVLGTEQVELRDGQVHTGDGESMAYCELVGRAGLEGDVLSVTGAIKVPDVEPLTPDGLTANLSPTYAFAAHGVEVEVDPATGRITVLDYVAAHDVGTAINPLQVEGQIRGGVVQGLGAALGEQLIHTDGRVANPSFLHYPVPRAGDRIPVRPIIVEAAGDDAGPYGAKSVGEMAIGPVASALANAVADALGVRPTELPLTPDRVLGLLGTRPRKYRLARRPGRWWVAAIRWLYPRGLHRALVATGRRFGRPGRPLSVRRTVAPRDLETAIEGVGGTRRIVGGGTDLVPASQDGILPTTELVSLQAVPGMGTINEAADGGLRIGAAVTLSALAEDARTPPMMVEAIHSIASPQVRNVATIAGNLLQEKRCWFFRSGFDCYKRAGALNPCYAVLGDHRYHHAVIDGHRCQAVTPSDLATVLQALHATVELRRTDGSRRIPIADLFTGPGETCLGDGDVVTAIEIPASARERPGVFEKLQLTAGDFAVVSVAVAGPARDHMIGSDVVFGALAPTVWPAPTVAAAFDETRDPSRAVEVLTGLFERTAHPLPDNGWKLDAAEGLLHRALVRLLEPSKPEQTGAR